MSRGLGDVYKRQVLGTPMIVYAQEAISHFDNKYVVVGHQSEKVSSTLSETFIPVVQKKNSLVQVMLFLHY